MPIISYHRITGVATSSDIKNLEKNQEGKLDEIINLLDRLLEIEEENFRRRWGEDFKPKPKPSLILSHLPPNNTNKVVLPIGTPTTTSITRKKVLCHLT
jgi:hypothetical protein